MANSYVYTVNFWDLCRQLENSKKLQVEMSASWVANELLQSPIQPLPPVKWAISPCTYDPRNRFNEEHDLLLRDFRQNVFLIYMRADPLRIGFELEDLGNLVASIISRMVQQLRAYGNNVLGTLWQKKHHEDLEIILKQELPPVIKTVCLLHRIYGLEELARALESLNLGSMGVVEQTVEPLDPQQSLRRLQQKYPGDIPASVSELVRHYAWQTISAAPDCQCDDPHAYGDCDPQQRSGEAIATLAATTSSPGSTATMVASFLPATVTGDYADICEEDADGEFEEDFEYSPGLQPPALASPSGYDFRPFSDDYL